MKIKKNIIKCNNWFIKHIHDKYVIQAKHKKVRARSWFKLDQIQKKYKIFQKGMNIIDLGSSPGSWSQYAINAIGNSGKVISSDILYMQPINKVEFLQGDLRDQKIFNKLLQIIGNKKIHLVMSDMSPNFSGFPEIDIPKSRYLIELALHISSNILISGGSFIVKIFHGSDFNDYLKKIHLLFLNTKVYKPNASLPQSREIYVIATGYKK